MGTVCRFRGDPGFLPLVDVIVVVHDKIVGIGVL